MDDFVIVFEGDTRSELEKDANDKIKNFKEALHQVNLNISEEKTKVILFGGNILNNDIQYLKSEINQLK